MKHRITRFVVTTLLVVIGLGMISYPYISNRLYEDQQSELIRSYQEETDSLDDGMLAQEIEKAHRYNETLSQSVVVLTDPFDVMASKDRPVDDYEKILNVNENGIMGYVEIPCIDVYLPIYHGTDAEVLEQGLGHLEATSFPVGGEGTHAVISGHTGLPGKKLLSDLELMEKGNLFLIHVFNETLAYEVDQILVVEPANTQDLHIVPGEDLVTLITCTPYGVNSHRLLVRGHRVPVPDQQTIEAETTSVTEASPWMYDYTRSMLFGLGTVGIVVIGVSIYHWRKRR